MRRYKTFRNLVVTHNGIVCVRGIDYRIGKNRRIIFTKAFGKIRKFDRIQMFFVLPLTKGKKRGKL